MLVLPNDYKFYYTLSLASFIVLGSVKSLLGREPIFMIFLIVPSIYYLHLLKRENMLVFLIEMKDRYNILGIRRKKSELIM